MEFTEQIIICVEASINDFCSQFECGSQTFALIQNLTEKNFLQRINHKNSVITDLALYVGCVNCYRIISL